MVISVPLPPFRRLGFLAATLAAAACVDGTDPMGPALLDATRLTAAPVFGTPILAAESVALDRVRVVALHAATGATLATLEQDLDPTASEWVLQLSVELPRDQPTPLRLQVELVAGGVVEWSGRTGRFEVRGGATTNQVREVALYRGPVANLDVTGVAVRGPATVVAGQSAVLEADLAGGGGQAQAFWKSLDPAVATVDRAGRMTATAPGIARIVAAAGPAADTLAVTVREVTLPNAEEVARSVAPGLVDAAGRVAGSMGDPAGAAAISSALGDLGAALSAGDGAAAVGAFEAARAAWEGYGASTNLRQLDAPLLGAIEITLIHAADALGIAFG